MKYLHKGKTYTEPEYRNLIRLKVWRAKMEKLKAARKAK